jgi:hypothetical protein
MLARDPGAQAQGPRASADAGSASAATACPSAVSAAGANQAYTATQLASAYRFSALYSAGDEGAGQTIALFELEPYAARDVAAYQSCYGTSATVANVPVDGGDGTGYGPTGETALDIEDVIGLAPQARILVYEGPNTGAGVYDTYNAIVSSDQASVVSTSWGECEADLPTGAAAIENTLFEEAAAQGQSLFAAAGDAGSADCYVPGVPTDESLAVDDPASQPFVTGVGGTTMSAPGPPPPETVWNAGCANGCGGGGGGVSTLWTMPSYQSQAPASLNVVTADSSGSPCGAPPQGYCREVPDVAADADPSTGYVIYYGGAWTAFGGTSAAAPLWAAFAALANASSGCAGKAIGFANPLLYGPAAADLNDITTGNNDVLGVNDGKFAAGPGYDMASGLGTPDGSALAAAMCNGADVNGVTIANPGARTDLAGSAVTLAIRAVDAHRETLTYAATGLPAGVTISSSTGAISGTVTTAGSWSVIVTATDASRATASTTFTWTVTARATATTLSCAPTTVLAGQTTSCSATVSDTAAGTASAPTGTVDLTGAGAGSSCSLAATATTGASACQLAYTPTAPGAQTVTADYLGDGAHAASSSSAITITVPAPPTGTISTPAGSPTGTISTPAGPPTPTISAPGGPPVLQERAAPALAGAGNAGRRLSCSEGAWTGSPTGYAYQWNRDGTPLAGATGTTYAVVRDDEGTTLTCTVTVLSAGGARSSATSTGVWVPVPEVARCPAATGRVRGTTLGRVRLGITRAQARAAYAGSSVRAGAHEDVFCLTPSGVDAGYPTARLLALLDSGVRAQLDGRVIWAATANARYAIDGVRPGATLAAARRALPGGKVLAGGRSDFYVASAGPVEAVLGLHGGLVAQVAIADKLLTRTSATRAALLASIA